MVNSAYSQTLGASSSNGGVAPYTFTVTAGALPTGLALNATTGVLSGNPTTVAETNFTVTAVSSNGFSASQTYSLKVAAAASQVTAITPVPTLNTWGLVLLLGLMGVLAVVLNAHANLRGRR